MGVGADLCSRWEEGLLDDVRCPVRADWSWPQNLQSATHLIALDKCFFSWTAYHREFSQFTCSLYSAAEWFNKHLVSHGLIIFTSILLVMTCHQL